MGISGWSPRLGAEFPIQLIGSSYCILSLALSMVVKKVGFGVKRHLSEASWQTSSPATMTEEQQEGNDCKTTSKIDQSQSPT